MEMRQRSQIPVEFFSDGYRLSGQYDARRYSLGDTLYDASSEYILMRNTYLSTIDHPADILSSYPVALIMKKHLTFALTVDQETALRHDQKRSQYQRPRFREVTLIVPFFEITGQLRLPGQVDPRVMLSSQQESFLVLLDTTARATMHPDIAYQGAGAIVNASRVSFMGMSKLV